MEFNIAEKLHTVSYLTIWDTPTLPEGSWEGGGRFREGRAVQTQMSMRRFFRAQRDEDYSQIQYLTAKCTRLAHDKGKSGRSTFSLTSENKVTLLHFTSQRYTGSVLINYLYSFLSVVYTELSVY